MALVSPVLVSHHVVGMDSNRSTRVAASVATGRQNHQVDRGRNVEHLGDPSHPTWGLAPVVTQASDVIRSASLLALGIPLVPVLSTGEGRYDAEPGNGEADDVEGQVQVEHGRDHHVLVASEAHHPDAHLRQPHVQLPPSVHAATVETSTCASGVAALRKELIPCCCCS
jgi:hypothetical protein